MDGPIRTYPIIDTSNDVECSQTAGSGVCGLDVPSAPSRRFVNKSFNLRRSFTRSSSSSEEGGGLMQSFIMVLHGSERKVDARVDLEDTLIP